ncbi:MAG: CpsD/CapB family tyrosine-protein kinase [Myxococcales bacterium]|nr:CpsD/CapB family tyrosine-protein kinase [Myxococcales bacterium]
MPDYPSRKPPGSASPSRVSPYGQDPRGGRPDELAGYFDQGAPSAHGQDLIDGDAATRVASAQSLFESERTYQDPGLLNNMGFPTAPGGWEGNDGEAVTLSADQMRGYQQAAAQMYNGGGDPYASYDPNGYVVSAQVVDQGGGQEYGMVVSTDHSGGYGAQSGAAGYSMLRVNPAEHLGSFSPDLVMMSHPDGFAASQFRTLRYRLEQEPDLQIIMVTSAREGEGKTITAANLALALAEGGRIQVLLIDGSLRNPALHKVFGIRGDLGLTSVLAARQNDPSMPIDVIRITASLNLIPAGPPVASAHAALSSEAAAVLIGQIRREFRYIIIDSAAVFGTAETLAWHGLIDKYLLIARSGMTTTEDLTAACDRLQRDKLVGVTFIGGKVKRK